MDTKAKYPGMEGWLSGFHRAGKTQLHGCLHLSRTHPRGASGTVVPKEEPWRGIEGGKEKPCKSLKRSWAPVRQSGILQKGSRPRRMSLARVHKQHPQLAIKPRLREGQTKKETRGHPRHTQGREPSFSR